MTAQLPRVMLPLVATLFYCSIIGLLFTLAKAPLSALAVFTFLGSWDSFLWPLVVLTSPENRTLPLVLAGLRSLYWSRYEMFAAGSMLTVLPVMIIYGLASKQFVRGIAMTGLKA